MPSRSIQPTATVGLQIPFAPATTPTSQEDCRPHLPETSPKPKLANRGLYVWLPPNQDFWTTLRRPASILPGLQAQRCGSQERKAGRRPTGQASRLRFSSEPPLVVVRHRCVFIPSTKHVFEAEATGQTNHIYFQFRLQHNKIIQIIYNATVGIYNKAQAVIMSRVKQASHNAIAYSELHDGVEKLALRAFGTLTPMVP